MSNQVRNNESLEIVVVPTISLALGSIIYTKQYLTMEQYDEKIKLGGRYANEFYWKYSAHKVFGFSQVPEAERFIFWIRQCLADEPTILFDYQRNIIHISTKGYQAD
jgi:hypothetical protein